MLEADDADESPTTPIEIIGDPTEVENRARNSVLRRWPLNAEPDGEWIRRFDADKPPWSGPLTLAFLEDPAVDGKSIRWTVPIPADKDQVRELVQHRIDHANSAAD
jgi:hypothetical protein